MKQIVRGLGLLCALMLCCEQPAETRSTESSALPNSELQPASLAPELPALEATPGVASDASTSSSGSPSYESGPAAGASVGPQFEPEDVAAILQLIDSDGDGYADTEETLAGSDPSDDSDVPDLDGDGIANRDDVDVDGDGAENGEDNDVDGDGIENGDDADVDGDGLDADEDDDDDGDGDPDETDNDEDGDGEPDCDCENGRCSDFGGFCFCHPGWQGESCDKFHCRDLRNCLNGTCVGPNACRCNQGWESAGRNVCNQFHCRDLRNCNGHGQCIGPALCDCQPDWQGGLADCSIHSCDRNPAMCDDGDPCTIDACDPRSGCTNRQMNCLGFDVCVGGNCVTSCGNASGCADGQACRNGGCVDDCEAERDCRDGDPCTSDECIAGHCENEPVICSLLEECNRGVCVSSCTMDSECDDGQKCNESGCFEECDDGDCEMDERCEDDVCVPVGCTDDDDCGSGESCDDNQTCVQDDQ